MRKIYEFLKKKIRIPFRRESILDRGLKEGELIDIKSYKGISIPCVCQPDVFMKPEELWIPGMWSMLKAYCPICKRTFYVQLPVSFGKEYPSYINCSDNNIILRFIQQMSMQTNFWIGGLYHAYKNKMNKTMNIRKIVNYKVKTPLIINCLDSCYGHCLSYIFKNSGLCGQIPRFGYYCHCAS